MAKENKDYCKCLISKSVYTENGDFGYWEFCGDCDKPLEDGFHYYDEPELY